MASRVVQRVESLSVKEILKGDLGSIPGSGRSPGGKNGNSIQYSCMENGQRSLAGSGRDRLPNKHFHFSPQFKRIKKERR